MTEHVAKLGVLLPITSRGSSSAADVVDAVEANILSSLQPHQSCQIFIGIDFDDDQLLLEQKSLQQRCQQHGITATTVVFPEDQLLSARQQAAQRLAPAGTPLFGSTSDEVLAEQQRAVPASPICWMWWQLALRAAAAGCSCMVLLGDDTIVETAGTWVDDVLDAFHQDPRLQCLVLKDAAEPGFPSFPVLSAAHLTRFDGHLLPPGIFVNQDADPFLVELYCCCPGAVAALGTVTVTNTRGGIQIAGAEYAAPLYERRHASQARFRAALASWQAQLPADMRQDGLTVDILMPSLRADPSYLTRLLTARCSDPSVSLRFLLRVDDPAKMSDPTLRTWLLNMQSELLHRVFIRFNPVNCGAALTRNLLLDDSYAELCILWDDDVQPLAGCIDAYVRAFREHPGAAAFAGPTLMPRDTGAETLWKQGVRLSNVLYAWELPLLKQTIPWAITANMAVRNTTLRFGASFPKAGGGEDIDFCLRLGGAKCIAEAGVIHPWWGGGLLGALRHIRGWAFGDALLIDMYPELQYRCAPNLVECMLLLAAACLLRVVSWAVALTMGSAMVAADVLQDICSNFLLQWRWELHPEPRGWRRVAASCCASLCKTASNAGRLCGHLRRRRPGNICRRFDWWAGQEPNIIRGEKQRASGRAAALAAAAAAGYAVAWLLGR